MSPQELNRVDQLREKLNEFNDEFLLQYSVLTTITEEAKNGEYSDSELVDLGFFMREISALADDLRKEAKQRMEMIGRIICQHKVKAATQNGTTDLTTRGKFATGSSQAKISVVAPKAGTPEFDSVCEIFGINPGKDPKLVKIHFPRLNEVMNERMQDGLRIPDLKQFPDFVTSYRKKPVKKDN